jgi:hypothetical protein
VDVYVFGKWFLFVLQCFVICRDEVSAMVNMCNFSSNPVSLFELFLNDFTSLPSFNQLVTQKVDLIPILLRIACTYMFMWSNSWLKNSSINKHCKFVLVGNLRFLGCILLLGSSYHFISLFSRELYSGEMGPDLWNVKSIKWVLDIEFCVHNVLRHQYKGLKLTT